mgnify:CR=1 FL=1
MSKVAIITGASSGIGAATARQFLAAGFTTFNVSRRPCQIEGVSDICGDLSTQTDAQALATVLANSVRQIDASSVCLVHNASLMLKDHCDDCPDDAFSKVMQINVSAINTLNNALMPCLHSSSSVLYVGSTLSEKAVSGAFSYIVSKHAQLGMMRATCQDLMGKGIHTALICPGFTDTEMLRQHVGNDADVIASISQMNSFKRLVRPEEIAEMLFWAHHNPVINGSVMHGNLGQLEH